MDLIELIESAINHIFTVFINGGSFIMDVAEAGLRVPLQQIGLHGPAQTLAVAMVPLLTLIASVKILKGIVRGVVVVCLVMFVGHSLWPLLTEVPPMLYALDTR